MTEIMNISTHNFSKIGKYISNKLHHIKSNKQNKAQIKKKSLASKPSGKQSIDAQQKNIEISKKFTPAASPRKESSRLQPTVGSYHVNFSLIEKSIHQYNFNRSTPHFFGPKLKLQQVTAVIKQFPDGFASKSKGFTELKRMIGREQIKGSIRKNIENPHQLRFETHRFPQLSQRSSVINFEKMSSRDHAIHQISLNVPDFYYEDNRVIGSKVKKCSGLNFDRQKSRNQELFIRRESVQNYDDLKRPPQMADRSVAWNKQLARSSGSNLPSYMEKTVASRMSISQINFKTLQMNCSSLKEQKKLRTHKNSNFSTIDYSSSDSP